MTAHELAHIGNHDTRQATVLAAIVATLWLPSRMATSIFAALFSLHPVLWAGALL